MAANRPPHACREKGADDARSDHNRQIEPVLRVPLRRCERREVSSRGLIGRSRTKLTPPGSGRPQVSPPHRGETDPLGNERAHGVQSQRRPPVHHWSCSQQQARVTARAFVFSDCAVALGTRTGIKVHALLVPAISGELESPMERAEEGQHDRSIRRLDIQGLVKNRDGDTGIDGRNEACRIPSASCPTTQTQTSGRSTTHLVRQALPAKQDTPSRPTNRRRVCRLQDRKRRRESARHGRPHS